jgi:sulfate adenylyltransferase subunit 1 (EFTu-like GTPase family)
LLELWKAHAQTGDEVVFYPSGKKTHVNKIEPMSEHEENGKANAGLLLALQ